MFNDKWGWKDTPYKNFLSNDKSEYKNLILQAAKETGYNIIVEDEATTRDGYPLLGYVAIYTKDLAKDHAKFWNRLHELKEEMNHAS